MSDLTDKQQVIRQLAALRLLAMHVGLITSARCLKPNSLELGRRIEQYGIAVPMMCLLVIADERASPIARAASGLLLESFLPDWKEQLGPRFAGMVAERSAPEVRKWRAAVLARDGYQCMECKTVERLEAHHILHWADAPSLRLVVENGLTLCKTCHVAEHTRAA